MKLIINGKQYAGVSLDQATLADWIALKTATGLSRADLIEQAKACEGLTVEELGQRDEAILLTGISVWLSRRHAGERLTLEEACDVPMTDIEFVAELGDPGQRQVTPDPHLAADLEVSGPAATPRPPVADRQPKKKASKRASTPA